MADNTLKTLQRQIDNRIDALETVIYKMFDVQKQNKNKSKICKEHLTAEDKTMPRKLKHGQGSIIQRTRINKNGSLYVYYQGRCYANGKNHYTTAGTYTECYKNLTRLKIDIAKRKQKTINNFTVGSWLNFFIENYKKSFVAKKTVVGYYGKIKLIENALLAVMLNKVTVSQLQECIIKVNKIKGRSSQLLYDFLNMAFNQAYLNGLIKTNISLGLSKPSYLAKVEKPLSWEQQQFVLQNAEQSFKDIVTAYIWSGCRADELLKLKWECYNAENKTLYIDGTKTKTSKRIIPVFPQLKAVIEKQKHTSEYIFDISEKTIDRYKKKFKKKTKLHFTLKALRHTFNQNMYEWGVDEKTRSKWLGHANAKTTKTVYTHATESAEKASIEKVKKALQKYNN